MSKEWNQFPFSATQEPRPQQRSLKWTNWFTSFAIKAKILTLEKSTASLRLPLESSAMRVELFMLCEGQIKSQIFSDFCKRWLLFMRFYSEPSSTFLKRFLCLRRRWCSVSPCWRRWINRILFPFGFLWGFFISLRQRRMDLNPMFLISECDKSCRLVYINGDCLLKVRGIRKWQIICALCRSFFFSFSLPETSIYCPLGCCSCFLCMIHTEGERS